MVDQRARGEIEPFGGEWYSLFTTFKYSAFRLELLPALQRPQ